VFRRFAHTSAWFASCIGRSHPEEDKMSATIEETIERVEQLYTALIGTRPPQTNGHRTPIPPEVDPIVHVQEQLGRMVSLAERLVPMTITPEWIPSVTVWMHETDLVFAVDVPGVLARDVRIRVEPNAITVTGHRRPPWAQTPKHIAARETGFGAFARTFPLATRVTADQISARLDDGLLVVRVHNATRAEPSQIPIMS
jgi:HSP20 family molecular chaperone IbpA